MTTNNVFSTPLRGKRRGMLSSTDLSKKFHMSSKFFRQLLKRFYDENVQFSAHNQSFPMVERVLSGNKSILALSENPLALKKLKKLLFDLGINLNLSSVSDKFLKPTDLVRLYGRSTDFHKKILALAHKNNVQVQMNGCSTSLVQRVHSYHKKEIFVIQNTPQAIEIYKNFAQNNGFFLNLETKREGMLTPNELAFVLGHRRKLYRELYKQAFDAQISFIADGKKHLLIERVQNGGNSVFALSEHPQAIEVFKKFAHTKGYSFVMQQKRDGMKTSLELFKKLGKRSTVHSALLEKMFDDDIMFEYQGKKIPLVEEVNAGSIYTLAIHESPEAYEAYISQASKYGYEFNLPEKRPGMLIASDLKSEFPLVTCLKLFKHCYINNLTFDVDGVHHPLIERVTSNKQPAYALHEHPKALQLMKKIAIEQGYMLDLPPKQKDMKSAVDMANLFIGDFALYTKLFKLAYDRKETFVENGKSFPLITCVSFQKKPCLVLNNNKTALLSFKKFALRHGHNMDIQPKRVGMRTGADFQQEFGGVTARYVGFLNELYDQRVTIMLGDRQVPIVEEIKAGTQNSKALIEQPEALEIFKAFALQNGYNMTYPKKREGMLNATDMHHKFGLQPGIFKPIIKKAFDQKLQFFDGTSYKPVVEHVKAYSVFCYAVHEHPAALKTFAEFAVQQNPSKLATIFSPILINKNQQIQISKESTYDR